jgi:hypothetical protein
MHNHLPLILLCACTALHMGSLSSLALNPCRSLHFYAAMRWPLWAAPLLVQALAVSMCISIMRRSLRLSSYAQVC